MLKAPMDIPASTGEQTQLCFYLMLFWGLERGWQSEERQMVWPACCLGCTGHAGEWKRHTCILVTLVWLCVIVWGACGIT